MSEEALQQEVDEYNTIVDQIKELEEARLTKLGRVQLLSEQVSRQKAEETGETSQVIDEHDLEPEGQ